MNNYENCDLQAVTIVAIVAVFIYFVCRKCECRTARYIDTRTPGLTEMGRLRRFEMRKCKIFVLCLMNNLELSTFKPISVLFACFQTAFE